MPEGRVRKEVRTWLGEAWDPAVHEEMAAAGVLGPPSGAGPLMAAPVLFAQVPFRQLVVGTQRD